MLGLHVALVALVEQRAVVARRILVATSWRRSRSVSTQATVSSKSLFSPLGEQPGFQSWVDEVGGKLAERGRPVKRKDSDPLGRTWQH